MFSKHKPGLGGTAALGLVTDRQIRRAAVDAGGPVARLGWGVGSKLARRRANRRAHQISDVTNALSTLLSTYGPALLEQLGLVEPPKRKRTLPRVATGALIGAGAMYLLDPATGAAHRRQVQHLVKH